MTDGGRIVRARRRLQTGRRSLLSVHGLVLLPLMRLSLLPLAMLLASALLAGCTPPGLPPPVAPAAASASGEAPPGVVPVTVGIDGTVVGFNPHAISDYSPADAAVAALVLPSVSTTASDGQSRLNTDVVSRAVVTAQAPFTVTYTIDRDAAWSDGTPITAEDFSYLRDQMLVQPGSVDPAGYRLITSIVSRDAGKSVTVTFKQPVPDWLTLFSPLLPSHILKDSPGGWTTGLATGIPVSGNRYKMQDYDPVTGEITLTRNDKYWGTQPGPTSAVLRLGTAAALIAALGRGELQAVLLQPGAADQQALTAAVPADRRVTVPLPGTVQLIFNTLGDATADPAVRRAVAAALDLGPIRAALDGGNSSGMAAAPSLVSLSAGPGAGAGAGAGAQIVTGDPSAALAELRAAGYRRAAAYLSRAGQVLRLTLGYPGTDDRMAAAARLVQTQLGAIGIEVDLLREDPRALIDTRLALGTVDLGLSMVPRGSSDGLAVSSAFQCPLPVASGSGPAPATVPAGGSPAAAPTLPRAGNLAGFCDAQTEPLLGEAAAGSVPPALDRLLVVALPVLPLGRPSAVFATSAAIAPQLAAAGPGWTFSGPLSGLPGWPSY